MIKISMSGNPGELLYSKTENGESRFPVARLEKALPGLNSETIEHVNARVEDDLVVGVVTVAQGQGGLVFVWDPIRDKLLHVSDGTYALTAVIKGDKVISLHDVAYWGVPQHFELKCISFGTMDAGIDPEPYSKPVPEFSSEYDGNPDQADLILKDSRLYMKLNEETLPVDGE